jgi:hypothetical protein
MRMNCNGRERPKEVQTNLGGCPELIVPPECPQPFPKRSTTQGNALNLLPESCDRKFGEVRTIVQI